jgi:hypothetical protein
MSFGADFIKALVNWVISQFENKITPIFDAIAKTTYKIPHPAIDTPSDIYAKPDAAVWAGIHDFHFEVGIPVGISILLVMWILRKAGVATNIISAGKDVGSDKNLIAGIFGVIFSYYVAITLLYLGDLITTAIAPGQAQLKEVAGQLAGATGGVALFLYFTTISVNTALIVAVALINVIRHLIAFMLPMFAWVIAVGIFGKIPIISPAIVSIGKKAASSITWVFPVAAGWRAMVVLNNNTEPGDGIVAALIGDDTVLSVIDPLLSSVLFMVPLILGVASPVLLIDVTKISHLKRLTGVSFGKEGQRKLPDGDQSEEGNMEQDGMEQDDDEIDLEDGDPDDSDLSDEVNMVADDAGSDRLQTLKDTGSKIESAASTAGKIGKQINPVMDNDTQYFDDENWEKTKSRAGSAGEIGKQIADETGKTALDALDKADEVADDGQPGTMPAPPDPAGGAEPKIDVNSVSENFEGEKSEYLRAEAHGIGNEYLSGERHPDNPEQRADFRSETVSSGSLRTSNQSNPWETSRSHNISHQRGFSSSQEKPWTQSHTGSSSLDVGASPFSSAGSRDGTKFPPEPEFVQSDAHGDRDGWPGVIGGSITSGDGIPESLKGKESEIDSETEGSDTIGEMPEFMSNETIGDESEDPFETLPDDFDDESDTLF